MRIRSGLFATLLLIGLGSPASAASRDAGLTCEGTLKEPDRQMPVTGFTIAFGSDEIVVSGVPPFDGHYAVTSASDNLMFFQFKGPAGVVMPDVQGNIDRASGAISLISARWSKGVPAEIQAWSFLVQGTCKGTRQRS